MKVISKSALTSLFLLVSFAFLHANNSGPKNAEKTKVIIKITDIRKAEGEIGLGVYTSDDNFEDEVEYLSKTFSKTKMENGTLTVELFLPPGTYGIALLDDEDRDGEMDFGLMMPDEGFGFSNYYHSGLSKPDFEDFAFKVENETERVKIKVKYM